MSPPAVHSSVYFHPSIWGDHFIASSPNDFNTDIQIEERIKELKTEVKQMLKTVVGNTLQQMNLIDNIQRLGLSYHFQTEIDDALQMIYNDHYHNHQPYGVALRFRLLRQAGYYISPDVFDKLKNEKGEFDENLSVDVHGMLSLYEAAHLSYKGEDVLDDIIAFTTRRLKLMLSHHLIDSPLARKVQHALELPLQKRFPRLEAKHYISMYQEDESRIDALLEFAKLDFNVVQLLHRRELSEVCRWWKDVDILRKLPIGARDRAVEIYAMAASMIDEPQYSLGRTYTAKLFIFVMVIDDLYDVYKNMDELQPLTDAILRWDAGTLVESPEYLKEIFIQVIKLFDEYGEELAKRGQPYNISYLKQSMQELVRCQTEEAKIFNSRQVPTLREWQNVSLVAGGIPFAVMGSLLDTKEHATKVLDWALNKPDLITMVALICGLLGDKKSFEFEQERGNMASNLTCYMKDHGLPQAKALEHFEKMLKDVWKDINKQCLKPTPMPKHLLVIPINLARVIEVLYIYDNAFTESRGQAKEVIASMFVRFIPI